MTDLAALLRRPEFPRSSAWDPRAVVDHSMGPNALWLLEWLCQAVPVAREDRVLDLGCGKALTSAFLARELGARVWAADLWIGPDGNWRRAAEAGVADRVCPIRAEAHALPFARGFFDAVVSVDAYQYFGTDELYLGYLSRFLRPGGWLGVVVPGLMRPLEGEIPAHLRTPQANGKVFWEEECACFKTAEWWRELWGRSARVAEVRVEPMPDGWRRWLDFERLLEREARPQFPSDAETLERDQGRYLGFLRLTARRTGVEGADLYDPALGLRVGADR